MSMNCKTLLVSGLFSFSSLMGFAWGQKGHDTTAFIAENHLTPITKAVIDDLLDGKSIVYYANWLDNASHTPEYAYSKTWHYKNIDEHETFENAKLLETGDIVRAIYEQTAILEDPSSSREDKQLALKMVVHLLGDIHQPMHMGRASDRGGNKHGIKYFGRDNNLHAIWDSSLPESAHKWTYTEWQQQIDRVSDDEEKKITYEGTPEKWAKETYEIASEVYAGTPENTNVSYDYIADWTPVIETQFLRGGLRLADLLNSIFDPYYSPNNLIVKK